ncbi:MAG: hypothetical protein HY908_12390 [Myxococcales bacterium]|nr:hypothetical protein [Myxococcales bacterium]
MSAPALAPRSAPRASALFATSLLLWGCAQSIDAVELERSAAAWRPGDGLPAELLAYRPRTACLHLPSDSAVVIGGIDNVPLLVALATAAGAPEPVVELCLEQALRVAGPDRVYAELARAYRERPELAAEPVHQAAQARAREPHAWVEALYVRASDLPEPEARALLAALGARLEAGEPLSRVYREALGRERGLRAPDAGTERAVIGNLGDFVVSPSKRDAAPYRYAEVPEEHLGALLAAPPGAVLVLAERGRGSTAPGGDRIVLYRVREHYAPGSV